MLRLALALVLLLPAAADAAPFGELPFQPSQGPARCLQATGVPGELVRWAPDGVDIFQATRSGFGPPVHVAFGEPDDVEGLCPFLVTQPSGAALMLSERSGGGLDVAVREPGGSWQTQLLPDPPGRRRDDIDAAVSARGDAVIGWQDQLAGGGGTSHRVLITRRPAGGTFGAPEALTMTGKVSTDVVLGMAGDGTTLALLHNAPRVAFLTAPLGSPFGPPQNLTGALENAPKLTVAPDGRALAVVPETDARTQIFERAPGGAFAPVGLIKFADTFFGGLAVAMRPDGGAIVSYKDFEDQVLALRRDRPGAFGAPEKVGPQPPADSRPDSPIGSDAVPSDPDGREMHAVFAPDGRPVLAWGLSQRTGPLAWAGAAVTTFSDGVQTLSGPLRDADSITPVILADGTPAVAWSDTSPGGETHLRLAIEGVAAAAEPPAPKVTFGRAQKLGGRLVVPFRCSAACDVRAAVHGPSGARRSLLAAGSGRLTITTRIQPIVLTRADAVRVSAWSGAPGARTARAQTLTAKLKVTRLPRVLGLKAVRRGEGAIVTWHADRLLSGASLVVMSSPTRARDDFPVGTVVHGKGRRRFRIRELAESGDRFIQIYADYDRNTLRRRLAVVRIR